MAGGTVAMPLINEGISLPEAVMGLRLAGLDGLERAGDMLRIGATATLTAAPRPGRTCLCSRGRREHGRLVDPQHGHGRRQPVHAAAGRRRRGRPAGARRQRDAGRLDGTRTAADRLLHRLHDQRPGADELVGDRRADRAGPARPSSSSGASTPTRRPSSRWPSHCDADGEPVTDARIALGAVGPHPIRASGAEAAIVGPDARAGVIAAGRPGRGGRLPALHGRDRHRLVPAADGRPVRRNERCAASLAQRDRGEGA